MPSVEIICVGQREPLDFSEMPMAVEAEPVLESHRQTPLFQTDFDQLQGCIYHLGSPHLKGSSPPRVYTASQLLTEWWDLLQFKPEVFPSVAELMERLLVASPEGRLVFTSDYQFGPDARRYRRPLTLRTFIARHQAGKLRVNALYCIIRG